MPNIIDLVALNNSIGTNQQQMQMDIADIDSLDPTNRDSSIFKNLVHAAVDPVNSAEMSATNLVVAMQGNLKSQGTLPDPQELVALQERTNQVIVQSTVIAKAANMATKSINELTHIQ